MPIVYNYKRLISEKKFLKVQLRAMRLGGTFIDRIYYNSPTKDILFRTRSGTDPRLMWYQTIRINDLATIDYISKQKDLDKIIRESGLKVHCFVGSTKVLTKAGYRPIRDVKEGDEVFTHRGRYKKVLKTFKSLTGVLVKLRVYKSPDSRTTIICTPEHRFLIASGEWKEAKDILSGEQFYSLSDEDYNFLVGKSYFYKTKEVYNLEVEEDQSYQVQGLYGHNCSCIQQGTRIRTKDGDKRIERVTSHDLVLSSDSQYHRVFNVLVSTQHKWIDFFLDNGYFLSVTENHRIRYLSSSGKVMTKEAKRLNVGDKLVSLKDILIFKDTISESSNYNLVEILSKEQKEGDGKFYDICLADKPHDYIANGVVVKNCPAFLYWGFQYKAWKEGYGLVKETRRPTIRNPHQQGYVCFRKGTKVLTKDGYKPIETLTIKDEVMSHSHMLRNILGIGTSHTTKLVRFEAGYGEVFVTPNHKFLTVRKDYEVIKEEWDEDGRKKVYQVIDSKFVEWKEAGDLKVGDLIVSTIVDTKIKAKYLSYCSDKPYKVRISEVEAIERIDTDEEVYNIEVQYDHTYLVGGVGLVCHNCKHLYSVATVLPFVSKSIAAKLKQRFKREDESRLRKERIDNKTKGREIEEIEIE